MKKKMILGVAAYFAVLCFLGVSQALDRLATVRQNIGIVTDKIRNESYIYNHKHLGESERQRLKKQIDYFRLLPTPPTSSKSVIVSMGFE
jgi:hypothetical protein